MRNHARHRTIVFQDSGNKPACSIALPWSKNPNIVLLCVRSARTRLKPVSTPMRALTGSAAGQVMAEVMADPGRALIRPAASHDLIVVSQSLAEL